MKKSTTTSATGKLKIHLIQPEKVLKYQTLNIDVKKTKWKLGKVLYNLQNPTWESRSMIQVYQGDDLFEYLKFNWKIDIYNIKFPPEKVVVWNKSTKEMIYLNI